MDVFTIKHFSDDCLHFGLTCHSFLNIQNSSRKCLKLGCSRLADRCSDQPIVHGSPIIKRPLNRFMQLESLSLGHCLKIKDSDLTPLLKSGSKLHYVYLSFCYSVTNIGLSLVSSGCKSLIEVNLACCKNITDRGIQSLNQNCLQLRSLNIYGCDKVSGVSFYGFSSTLSCLEANNCAFDSMGIGEIISGGGLDYLNLYHLYKWIEGNGLEAIVLGLASNLKVLNFHMCRFVEDDAIIQISIVCPLLQGWNLSYCPIIGIAGWEAIELYCNKLEKLYVKTFLIQDY